MIIELVGPPGSGKTHCASALAKEHGLPVVEIRWFGERYAFFALFYLLHRALMRHLFQKIREQTREIAQLWRMKIRRSVYIAAKEQKARLLGGGIIDEGFFQLVLTIYEQEASAGELEAYLRLLPRWDYDVCVVDAPDEVRERRMRERGKFPRRGLGEAYYANWQRIFLTNFVRLKEILPAHFRCSVRVNN